MYATLLKRCMYSSFSCIKRKMLNKRRKKKQLTHWMILYIGKLSYQDSAPDLITDSVPGQIPQTIMSLQELCPLLLGMNDKQLPTSRDDGVVAASS